MSWIKWVRAAVALIAAVAAIGVATTMNGLGPFIVVAPAIPVAILATGIVFGWSGRWRVIVTSLTGAAGAIGLQQLLTTSHHWWYGWQTGGVMGILVCLLVVAVAGWLGDGPFDRRRQGGGS
jgi:hypothetical protein